ncbi:MAG: hypothetical protein ACREQM_16490 [Candidatus Dormibacteraceae bacterium]
MCGMRVTTGPGTLSLELEGARHWFCGSGCRAAFASDPRRYLQAPASS